MSATSARAARREGQAAAALGSTRVHRRRGESAPDVVPIVLPNGTRLQPEVKSRLHLPRLVVGALEQAEGYARGTAIPLAVLFAYGATDGIACVPLSAFAALVGLNVAVLPKARPLARPRPSPQLTFPGCG